MKLFYRLCYLGCCGIGIYYVLAGNSRDGLDFMFIGLISGLLSDIEELRGKIK